MDTHSIRVEDVLQVARSFRERAAEAIDGSYCHLMLRTAAELEELADTLTRRHDGELAIRHDELAV